MSSALLKKLFFSSIMLTASTIATADIIRVEFTGVVNYEHSHSNPQYYDPNGQFKWEEYDWGLDVGDTFTSYFDIPIDTLHRNTARAPGHSVYRHIFNPTPNPEYDIVSSPLQQPTLANLGYYDYFELLDFALDPRQTRDQLWIRDSYYYVDDSVYEQSKVEFNLYDTSDFINTGSPLQSFSLNQAQLENFDSRRGAMTYEFYNRNSVSGSSNKIFNQMTFEVTGLKYNVVETSAPASFGIITIGLICLFVRRSNRIKF